MATKLNKNQKRKKVLKQRHAQSNKNNHLRHSGADDYFVIYLQSTDDTPLRSEYHGAWAIQKTRTALFSQDLYYQMTIHLVAKETGKRLGIINLKTDNSFGIEGLIYFLFKQANIALLELEQEIYDLVDIENSYAVIRG